MNSCWREKEMEEYTRKCERIGGELTAMMEVSNGGVRSTGMEVITSSNSKSYTKRRKVDSDEVLESCKTDVQLEIQCRRVVLVHTLEVAISPKDSETANHVLSSLCSSHDSSEAVKDSFGTLDLKAESFETEMSKSSNVGFSRETIPSSEVCLGSEIMESSTPKKKSASSSCRRKPTESKIPSATEIEEFFSVAEKYEQKRFADKYNYDIVKDVPLEGRYQWVKLQP